MKKIALYASIVTKYLLVCQMYADPIISLTVQPYPSPTPLPKEIRSPKKRAKSTIQHLAQIPTTTGVYASYGGFLRIADTNGQLFFPRKHTEPFIYLVVTDRIVPIRMMHKTINHWEFDPETTTKLYKIEQKRESADGPFFWHVQEEPLPPDNIIPLRSLIIFAKPKNVFVPTGITIIGKKVTRHLLLPDIYIKKGFNIVKNSLYVLTINNWLQNVAPRYKKDKKVYLESIE